MTAIFALHDYDEKLKAKGAIDITKPYHNLAHLEDDAMRGNKKGYGIFWVVNDFEGSRKKENLKRINFWYCDIDNGSKEEQLCRIEALLIPPSFVVETKNGYHCYWGVKGSATIENFDRIEMGLIKLLDGDKHCKDPLRLLRMPYYYHMKTPSKPFLIQIVEGLGRDKEYTEEQMLNWLCRDKEEKPKEKKPKCDKNDFLNEENWERMFKISEIHKGNRNGMFTRYVFWLKDEGLSSSEIEYVINGLNSKLVEPLPDREIKQLLRTKIC